MTTNGLFQPTYNSALKQDIVRVHGENGARAYRMPPNSSALLLDDTDAIVWFVQTDGAGYQSISPFSITPYESAPAVDVKALEQRIKKIEERLYESDNSNADMAKV